MVWTGVWLVLTEVEVSRCWVIYFARSAVTQWRSPEASIPQVKSLAHVYNHSRLGSLQGTPSSWDPQFSGFHSDPNFENPVGEVIVDGVTVTMPLLEAVRSGLIEVISLLQHVKLDISLVMMAVHAQTNHHHANLFLYMHSADGSFGTKSKFWKAQIGLSGSPRWWYLNCFCFSASLLARCIHQRCIQFCLWFDVIFSFLFPRFFQQSVMGNADNVHCNK